MEKELKEIVVTVGTFEGAMITQVITVEEQKDAIANGYTVEDLLELYLNYFWVN